MPTICDTKKFSDVTLCRWSAKQTIPLSVLARNQTKGFGLEISAWPEVVRGREKRVDKRSSKLGVGEGRRKEAVDTSQHERGSRPVKDRVKMSRHSSSFVEISLDSTLALVCTCTMLHKSPSALELTLSVCSFVLFFLSCSVDCIRCSGKEMCVTPIRTTSWLPAVKKWNG